MNEEEWYINMIHIFMKQYVLKRGLRKFKDQGESEVPKEMTQLHVIETSAPVDSTKLIKNRDWRR